MYRRDNQQMPESEEGAAFFQPMTFESEMGMVPPRPMGLQPDMLTGGFAEAQARNNAPRVMGLQPGMLTGGFAEAQARVNAPRVMGLQPGMLTNGFPGARGMGADDESGYVATVAAMNPWVVGGVAAALGFGGMCLWRKR